MMGELIITVPWSRERLENERDASIFISQNTTIRVPKFLDFSVESDIASISMEAVDGDPMDELAKSLNSEDQKTLTSNVFTYINDTVLPQSNRLRSGTLGSVRGKIVPPYRLQERDGRPHWLSRTSISKGYVYCHNDLAQHNILINPETLQVAAIIDWEFSGFYPQGFEFPFWLEPRGRIRQADEEDEEDPAVENLIKLIVEPDANGLLARPWAVSLTRLRATFSGLFFVARDQEFHHHVKYLLSIQKPSTVKANLVSVLLIEHLVFLYSLTHTRRHEKKLQSRCRRPKGVRVVWMKGVPK